jgi:hypothetical protein
VKLCSQEGCRKRVQQGGVCYEHGARVKRCKQDWCKNQVQTGGVCIKHGVRKRSL